MKDIKNIGIYLSFLCVLVLNACTSELPPVEYVKFINDEANGLNKSKNVADVTMHVQHKPISYVVANEFRKNSIPEKEYQKRYDELVGAQYYTLKLAVEGSDDLNVINYQVANESQQQDRLYYLSFAMKSDIKLVEGSDTLRPVLYHFERSYDLADHRTFVLAFEQKEENIYKEKTFILDSGMFTTGPLKIKFEESDLRNVPTMKIEP